MIMPLSHTLPRYACSRAPRTGTHSCTLPLARRMYDVVHSYQMALKRLRNLLELVEAEGSEWRQQQRDGAGGGGSSSADASAAGSSSSNPLVL